MPKITITTDIDPTILQGLQDALNRYNEVTGSNEDIENTIEKAIAEYAETLKNATAKDSE